MGPCQATSPYGVLGLAFSGDYAWGARGRGMWRGSYGDSGQVLHLNLLLDPLEPRPGLRTAWPAQPGQPRGSGWGLRGSGPAVRWAMLPAAWSGVTGSAGGGPPSSPG